MRAHTAIERALDEFLDNPALPHVTVDGRPVPTDHLSDLLGTTDHDLRVARQRRTSAADRVARHQRALEAALDAERQAFDRSRATGVLGG